jgi:hypothetical protein
VTRRYPIVIKRGRGLIAGAIAAAVLGVAMLYESARPHAAVLRAFSLDYDAAHALFLTLAAVAFGITGLALTMHVRRPMRELLVTDKAIILDGHAIHFNEITAIEEHTFHGQAFVLVRSAAVQIQVAKNLLADGAYEEIVAFLKSRVPRS